MPQINRLQTRYGRCGRFFMLTDGRNEENCDQMLYFLNLNITTSIDFRTIWDMIRSFNSIRNSRHRYIQSDFTYFEEICVDIPCSTVFSIWICTSSIYLKGLSPLILNAFANSFKIQFILFFSHWVCRARVCVCVYIYFSMVFYSSHVHNKMSINYVELIVVDQCSVHSLTHSLSNNSIWHQFYTRFKLYYKIQ